MLRLASDADVNGLVPPAPRDRSGSVWGCSAGTNDRNTMLGLIWQRIAAGDKLPGVIVTTNQQSIGSAIDDILLVAECMS
jgi:hypothetical protein